MNLFTMLLDVVAWVGGLVTSRSVDYFPDDDLAT